MNETQPPHEQQRSWIVAVTCSALVLLVAAGGVFAMRDQLVAESHENARKQSEEREKLTARVDGLQSALDTLSNQPKPDGAALDALTAKLSETTVKLDTLSARLETLEKKAEEKKPEPVTPPAPIPAPLTATAMPPEFTALKLAALSGKPFTNELAAWAKLHPQADTGLAPLSAVATEGIVSEPELIRNLLDALENKPEAPVVDDVSLIGKINTHLKGLVSIKKTSQADPLQPLRNAALHDDLATLTHEVERLDMPENTPLSLWLKKAHARAAALAALSAITPGGGQ